MLDIHIEIYVCVPLIISCIVYKMFFHLEFLPHQPKDR